MGIQKCAFNFIVEHAGKLTKSALCAKSTNIAGIKGLTYVPNKGNSFEIIDPLQAFFNEHKAQLKKLVTDKQGNFLYKENDKYSLVEISEQEAHKIKNYTLKGGKYYKQVVTQKGKIKKINIDKEYPKFNEKLGILEHGTSAENYESILNEGFKINKRKFAETFHGIYMTRLADGKNTYGVKRVQALCNEDVAFGDLNKISDFLYADSEKLDKYIKSLGEKFSSRDIKELLLKDEFMSRGLKGLYSSEVGLFAQCKALVIFNSNDLQIIK